MIESKDSEQFAARLREADRQLQLGRSDEALRQAMLLLEEAEKLANNNEIAESLRIASDCFYRMGRFAESFSAARESVRRFAGDGNRRGQAKAVKALANAYLHAGNTQKALEHYFRAAQIAEQCDDAVTAAVVFNNLSVVFANLDQYARSLEYCRKSLAIYRAADNHNEEAYTLNNLGMIYAKLGEAREARECYLQSLAGKRRTGDQRGEATAYDNIGETYQAEGNLLEALAYFQRSLDIRRSIDDPGGEALTLLNIAALYLRMDRVSKAVKACSTSIALARKTGDKQCLAGALALRGELQLADKLPSAALLTMRSALNLANELGHRSLVARCCKTLADTYASMGDFERALSAFERFHRTDCDVTRAIHHRRTQNLQLVQRTERARSLAALERDRNKVLAAKTTELERVNHRLRELSQEKSELLGIAAHDLKTPLSGITMQASLLLNYAERMPATQRLGTIQQISESACRMKEIIANILDLEAIDNGTLAIAIRRVDAAVLLRTVCKAMNGQAARKRIRIECRTPPSAAPVLADESALRQVLENLISNAVKYSPADTKVVCAIEERGSLRHFIVQDEGPGIREDERHRLFTRFARLSAKPTGNEHSTGLGLSIVKRLCNAMNAKIECDKKAGKGARFIVELVADS